MKVIDKEKLKQLIDDLFIEEIQIEEPLKSIDLSTLDGQQHQHRKDGAVKIVISGRVELPDEQL
jgi:hypothetical protein